MIISELIQCLSRRLDKHGDVEVKITWESITVSTAPNKIYLSNEGSLYIDADENENFYKQSYAVDPNEGEDEC